MRGIGVLGCCLAVWVGGCSERADRAPTVGEAKTEAAFRDVSQTAFSPAPNTAGWPALAAFDYDNDGDIDLFVANSATFANHLYRNDGKGRFTDVADDAGVPIPSDGSSAVGVGDFDNDGWLDLIIARQLFPAGAEDRKGLRFMKNLGPDENGVVRFGEGTEPTGLGDVDFALSVGVGDIDNDGLLDLYLGRYDLRDASFDFETYMPDTPNVLLRNTGIHDGGVPIFEDITASAGVGGTFTADLDPGGDVMTRAPTFAVYFTDVNDDGYPDIFALKEVPGGVDLFINNGDLTFTLAEQDLLDKHGGWMGIAGGDFDRDGDEDYFLANVGADARTHATDPNHVTSSILRPEGTPFHRLLANNNGTLLDVISDITVEQGLLPPTNALGGEGLGAYEFGFGCAWFDLENDGLLDLTWTGNIITFRSFGDGPAREDFHGINRLLRNNGDGSFMDVTAQRGFHAWDDDLPLDFGYGEPGRALAALDLNGDGFQDVCRTFYALENAFDCLMNPALEDNHWITIRLEGTMSNRFGIGAKVEAQAGNERFAGEVVTTTSAFTAVHPQVHFGLGGITMLDGITVRWPSGKTTQISDVDVDQIVTIGESSR